MEYLVSAALYLCDCANLLRKEINLHCDGLEAWQIIIYTFSATIAAIWFKSLFDGANEPLWPRVKKRLIRFTLKLPYLKQKYEEEMTKLRNDMMKEVHKPDTTRQFFRALPDKAKSHKEVLSTAEAYKNMSKFKYFDGRVSGAVYLEDSKALSDLQSDIFRRYAYTNPLHADIFPETRKMEAEVVRMACTLFNGDKNSCGTMTTGGSESIMLACLAYRNRAYSMGNYQPEMVLPVTAHAAFDKAASYFRIRIRHVPVDKNTWAVDTKAVKKAINSRTCMLVGSAPHFPHGIIDDMKTISEMGLRYNIPVHVDACLGGFLIAFMDAAGYPLKPFDFRLPGVTSLSCDTHKYGFCPKGTSLVLYRNTELLHHQFFAAPEWPGGVYATPTFSGSRSGCNIGLTWATMLHFGMEGYIDATRKVIKTARTLADRIRKELPYLRVMGNPEVSVVAFDTDKFNIYNLSDNMTKKGWNLTAMHHPAALHICVTVNWAQEGVIDKFIKDADEISQELLNNPRVKDGNSAVMYGMAASIPDPGIVSEAAYTFFDSCYSIPDENEK